MTDSSYRAIEEGVATDLRDTMTYGSYLQLDRLLTAQQPVSNHHDEMLFIIQHQVTELWMKQLIHELRSAMELIAKDDLPSTLKRLARVKAIQRQMFEQWSVLETLTPIEYVQFRGYLGHASGFQSLQYRTVEFLLGNKNPQMLAVFAHDEAGHARISEWPEAMSDDLVMAMSFERSERAVVPDAHVLIWPPKTYADLLRRRVRAMTGNRQLELATPSTVTRRSESRPGELARIIARRPWLVPAAAVFGATAVITKARGREAERRGDSTWLRDESSRTG